MKLDFKRIIMCGIVVCAAITIIAVAIINHKRGSDLEITEVENVETTIVESDIVESDIVESDEEINETTDTTEQSQSETTTVETVEIVETVVEPTNNGVIYENTNEMQNYTESYANGMVNLGRFTLTAYCSCVQCCGQYALNRPVDENGVTIVYGSTGTRLIAGVSIAVDPRIIPYGSNVVINGHTYTAHDTGGAINGNRIDVYFDNHQDALNFGVQYADVYLVTN